MITLTAITRIMPMRVRAESLRDYKTADEFRCAARSVSMNLLLALGVERHDR